MGEKDGVVCGENGQNEETPLYGDAFLYIYRKVISCYFPFKSALSLFCYPAFKASIKCK